MFRRSLLKPIAGIALVVALTVPATVLAVISFSDVPVSNPFYADIQAVAGSGVTTGCGGGKFCPKDNVTREQMAAFMNRLGALAPDKTPVVNADKVDGLHASDFMPAGYITTQHYGPWTSNGNSTMTVKTWTNVSGLDSAGAGTQLAQLPLVAPTSVGGVTYGLASVKVCYDSQTTNSTIANTLVLQARPFAFIIEDYTARDPAAGSACYTVTDATPTKVTSNNTLLLSLNFSAAGSFRVADVTATWVPTTAVAAAGSKNQDGGGSTSK